MNIIDLLKKAFLEGFASTELSPSVIVTCLGTAALLGIYVFFAYRFLTRKAFFNKNFSIALIGVAEITAAIILTVQSSVVISLGMVGALSIVRFRTAVKDPLDLVFLFWAISVGIVCGAGLALVAVLLCLVLSILLYVFNALPIAKAPVLLLVSSSDLNAETKVLETASKHSKAAVVKSRSLTPERIDLIVELRSADEPALTAALLALPGTLSCSVVAHDGEVTF